MTEARYNAISELIQRQLEVSRRDPEEARRSLMRSGLYNDDGSLKQMYGGKKHQRAGR